MSKPRIDHIGVIVPDIPKALKLLESLFGVEPGEIKEKEAIGLRLAMVEFENVALELIQYTDENSSFKPILGQRDGMNHVSIRVPDMDKAVEALDENGVGLAVGFPFRGSRGPLAFHKPGTALGMLFELYQTGDRSLRGPGPDLPLRRGLSFR